MNNTTHPIELLIVALLAFIEGICWVINELAGFHGSKEAATVTAPTSPPPSPPSPFIQPFFTELQAFTVKQLREHTGFTSSRYRKADLIQLAYMA